MAADGIPGTEPNPDLNSWSGPELQTKLTESGAPVMGPREELIDRLKSYMMQTGVMLTKPSLPGGDDKAMTTMPGLPPMPPMPSMPLPPGMGVLQAMGIMGGPPPPGMSMEPPGISSGMAQDDPQKIAQRAGQGDSRVMEEQLKEQELLEQQKRAAQLLEHERQQELVKLQQVGPPGTRAPEAGPAPNLLPPIPPLRALITSGPPPPGVSMVPQSSQRQRVPPPPGEDAREAWQSDDVGVGPKNPQALEKILQLKEIRQEQLTAAPTEEEDDDTADVDMNSSRPYSDDEEESTLSKKECGTGSLVFIDDVTQDRSSRMNSEEDAKTMKTKMREKVRPKMGKIDIDYQKLHDAFFKWQIKQKLTIHGDLYYKGKEFETRLKEKKPGDLSDELRIALGMPTGPNSHKVPPPWLIAMQRYGPPPSYPNLKIPGLNAPIPENFVLNF
ncbi:splicing factor 3B subunit 2-like [Neoarius graeffei]|uniref:splicing factor 3B subunit 2-like n=1 Tax=Neoarius graeffei TaxID=443677 RepID=UPI00298C2715|nr:splicing factor 3B subunit 2-like [Neoarius graeffei]